MISVAGVAVEFSGLRAVDGASLAVGPGEAWGLIGRTGAGRSTLLAALAGALPLAAGTVTIDGMALARDPAAWRRLVGWVPAGLVAWPPIRAGEFLELFAAGGGLSGQRLRTTVERGLAMAGLQGDGQARIDQLPDGTAKRLLVARALLFDPRLLLLDDPFRGLDPAERRDLERLITDMTLVERAVIAAFDDGVVPACCTHVAVLAAGRVVRQGPAQPGAFPGRAWLVRVVVPGRAEEAAALVGAATVLDADALAIRLVGPEAVAATIARLVAAGIAVSEVGHAPPWSVQLLDES